MIIRNFLGFNLSAEILLVINLRLGLDTRSNTGIKFVIAIMRPAFQLLEGEVIVLLG